MRVRPTTTSPNRKRPPDRKELPEEGTLPSALGPLTDTLDKHGGSTEKRLIRLQPPRSEPSAPRPRRRSPAHKPARPTRPMRNSSAATRQRQSSVEGNIVAESV